MSFEPVKELADDLARMSVDDPDWIVYDFALSANDSFLDFNIAKNSVFSSFYQPIQTHIVDNGNVIERTDTVAVRRLDGVMSELEKERDLGNVFIKLDTQGHDLEVIKGLSRFDSVVAIQSETSLVPIYSQTPVLCDTLKFFKERYFEVAGMFPVNIDTQHRVVEFDCLFVRTQEKIAQIV